MKNDDIVILVEPNISDNQLHKLIIESKEKNVLIIEIN